jgi:spore coat polysaccharide biosynthesis predicted glycosyltransferase SpsG
MSIFENQTYRKKLVYFHNDDNEKEVTFNLSINTNHDIDKSVLIDIEKTIESMFFNSYQNADVIKKAEDKIKELKKMHLNNIKEEKQEQKRVDEYRKRVDKENLQIEKNRLKQNALIVPNTKQSLTINRFRNK